MSLLIKALANAEKDKQAELSKKHSAGHVSAGALPLELAPIEAQPESLMVVQESDIQKPSVKSEQSSGLGLAGNALADSVLSLEEEAGFVTPAVAERKRAKSKADTSQVKVSHEIPASTSVPSANTGGLASAGLARSAPASAAHQKVAASVFVANQPAKTNSSKSALVLLGIAGALMIWLGLQGYQYIQDLTVPDVVVIKQPAPLVPQVAAPVVASVAEPVVAEQSVQPPAANPDAAVVATVLSENATKTTVAAGKEAAFKVADNSPITVHEEVKKVPAKPLLQSRGDALGEDGAQLKNAVQSVPLKLISRTPAAGVDPTLLSAYQAFSRGEDAHAQQQYRQVLQRDVRNVDALLGMAAIAQRQGRDADAVGWYQKVLEIEPKNTIALSAVVSPQSNIDVVGTESRIKNMLAQQPESANLHAALGNLYAEQNQWPQAQDAYFNASRFAPNSADYAFNLAISLDHLGKPGLALAQYQRALDLLNSSGASTPDRGQLEARIQALQAAN